MRGQRPSRRLCTSSGKRLVLRWLLARSLGAESTSLTLTTSKESEGTTVAAAELKSLSPEDNAALGRQLKSILAEAERDVAEQRRNLDTLKIMIDVHDDARNQGLIAGLKEAIALGGGVAKPKAHADAFAPWPGFLDKFFGRGQGWRCPPGTPTIRHSGSGGPSLATRRWLTSDPATSADTRMAGGQGKPPWRNGQPEPKDAGAPDRAHPDIYGLGEVKRDYQR